MSPLLAQSGHSVACPPMSAFGGEADMEHAALNELDRVRAIHAGTAAARLLLIPPEPWGRMRARSYTSARSGPIGPRSRLCTAQAVVVVIRSAQPAKVEIRTMYAVFMPYAALQMRLN